MKRRWCLLFFGLLGLQIGVAGQDKWEASKAYFFDGDEVVFEFDSRDYQQATHDKSGKKLDFGDLDIYKVSVSGEFNNWSRKKWKMVQVGPYKFQLRKKIKDISDQFTWEFKFLVNGKFWAEPNEKMPNKVYVDDYWDEVFNLQLKTLEPDENGNAYFFLEGFQHANQVILAGEFNWWNEEALSMQKVEEGWEIRLNLDPGRYEYKFIVDGEWMHDPNNPDKVRNIHKTFNSVLYIDQLTTFKLKGYSHAKQVMLAGTFNKWNAKEIPLERHGEDWIVKLPLRAGKHLYKFIVDGNWKVDPSNPLKERGRDGIVNSVLIVQ